MMAFDAACGYPKPHSQGVGWRDGNGSEKDHFDDNLVENLHTANWGDLPGAHSIVCGGMGTWSRAA